MRKSIIILFLIIGGVLVSCKKDELFIPKKEDPIPPKKEDPPDPPMAARGSFPFSRRMPVE